MAQVSRRRLSEKVEKRIEEIFLRTISKLNKEEDVLQFLNEFLTPTEKIVLSKRFWKRLKNRQALFH